MSDKNGKLFGKINIVDILAVILIAVLGVGIGVRFTGEPTQNIDNHQTFEYVVGIADVRAYTVEALEKMGDVYKAKTSDKAGTITKVEATPHIRQVLKTDGTVVDVEVPGKYEVLITIETEGRIGEMLYLDAANREIYRGGNIDWYTKWVQISSSQVKSIATIQD